MNWIQHIQRCPNTSKKLGREVIKPEIGIATTTAATKHQETTVLKELFEWF